MRFWWVGGAGWWLVGRFLDFEELDFVLERATYIDEISRGKTGIDLWKEWGSFGFGLTLRCSFPRTLSISGKPRMK